MYDVSSLLKCKIWSYREKLECLRADCNKSGEKLKCVEKLTSEKQSAKKEKTSPYLVFALQEAENLQKEPKINIANNCMKQWRAKFKFKE